MHGAFQQTHDRQRWHITTWTWPGLDQFARIHNAYPWGIERGPILHIIGQHGRRLLRDFESD